MDGEGKAERKTEKVKEACHHMTGSTFPPDGGVRAAVCRSECENETLQRHPAEQNEPSLR